MDEPPARCNNLSLDNQSDTHLPLRTQTHKSKIGDTVLEASPQRSSADTVGTSNLPLPVVVVFVLRRRAGAPPGMSKGAALCVLTGAQLLLL